MKSKEREKLWMAWGLLIFMLALIPSVHAEVFNCSSCLDCSQKIQTANPGDIIVLTADLTSQDGNYCIGFNGKDDLVLDCNGHRILGR